MPPSALVLLAEGAEEMEFVITVDVLRRAKIDVTVAGLSGMSPIKCSRDVTIVPDISLSDVTSRVFDAVIIPGGALGAQNLAKSPEVGTLLKSHYDTGKFVCAICAGPTVLLSHSVANGKKLTSHPGVKDKLVDSYDYQEARVVVDGNLVTSRAPGTSFEFGLQIVELLLDTRAAADLKPPMLIKD